MKERMRQKSPRGMLQYATSLASIGDASVGGSRVQLIGIHSHKKSFNVFVHNIL